MIIVEKPCLTSIHSPVEKLNRRYRHRLPFGLRKAVALVVCFGGINGINLLSSATNAVKSFAA